MANPLRHIRFLLPALALLHLACATGTGSIRTARDLFTSGHYDDAIVLLKQALVENPKNGETRLLLYRAKLNSYFFHLAKAREWRQANEKDKASAEYQKSLEIFPDNFQLKSEINDFLTPETPLKLDVKPSAISLPVALNVDSKKIIAINLTNHPIRNIFTELGEAAKVNVIIDREFRDFQYSIKSESTFFDILNQLCLAAVAQYRVLSTNSIYVYNSDNSLKKNNVELRGIKVFYLSNILAKDAKTLLNQFYMGDMTQQVRIQEDTNLNALIVKADYNSLLDLEKLINNIDKEKNEIGIDVEIVEVNRTLMRNLGNEFSPTALNFSAGVIDLDGTLSQTVPINAFSSVNGFLTLPSVTLNLLESDDKNKIIAKPNLRGVEGEEIKMIVGDQVPIPQTSFLPYATGGATTVPQTTYTYKDVGVEVSVTPYLHKNNEITLKTKMTVQFISGTVSLGTNQTASSFGKREVSGVIRLKEGETNIIAGLIRDDERRSLKGIPAFSDIPILGRLFGSDSKTVTQTDLIFAITPHILRRTPIDKTNTDVIWSMPNPQRGAETTAQPVMPGRQFALRQPGPTQPTQVTVVMNSSLARLQAKGEVMVSAFLQTTGELNSVALSGTIQGGPCEIIDIGVENRPDIRTVKNFAGNSFDLNFVASREHGISGSMPLGQIQLRLLEKGRYTITLNAINAIDSKMTPVAGLSQPVVIDVQ
jgi:general secretion pathway protein D